jgi:hypothetical protein
MPDLPLEESVDPAIPPTLEIAAREGVYASVYTVPYAVPFLHNPGLAERVPLDVRGYARDGTRAPSTILLPDAPAFSATEPDEYVIDYGSPAAQRWMLDTVYGPLIRDFGLRGAHTDVFSGVGAQVFYDPPAPIPPSHVAHGGDYYMQGKRALVANIREFWKAYAQEHQLDPKAFFLAGEGIEEFIGDKYDWVIAGYNYHANHLMFAEDEVLRWITTAGVEVTPPDAYAGVPLVSRNMSPPLWNMVHHEWAPAQHWAMSWNSVALSTNTYYPRKHVVPEEPDYTGIPPDHFVDLHAFFWATLLHEGARPTTFLYYRHLHAPLWALDDAGNPTIDLKIDPELAGAALREFFVLLHDAISEGPLRAFILYGRMERSLAVRYDGQGAALKLSNPAFYVFGQKDIAEFPVPYGLPGRFVAPAHLLVTAPYPVYQFLHTSYQSGFLDFPVPQVLHSVWSDVSRRVAVLLVNWSGIEAQFGGKLDLGDIGLNLRAEFRCRAFVGQVPVTEWSHFVRSPSSHGEYLTISTVNDPDALCLAIPRLQPRSLMVVLVEPIATEHVAT